MKKRSLTSEESDECRRLKALWESKKRELGLNQQSAADAIGDGVTQGAVSHYLNGQNALNLEVALVFSRLLKVPISEFSPRLYKEVAHVREASNVFEIKAQGRRVPVVSWVIAGKWCESPDNYAPGDAEEWVTAPFDCSGRSYCLVVSGPSMEPTYPDGCFILVDPEVEAAHNDDVVVREPQGRQNFKRLQITHEGKYLQALNPDHPERIIKIPEGTTICGVVIGMWTRRRRKK